MLLYKSLKMKFIRRLLMPPVHIHFQTPKNNFVSVVRPTDTKYSIEDTLKDFSIDLKNKTYKEKPALIDVRWDDGLNYDPDCLLTTGIPANPKESILSCYGSLYVYIVYHSE